MPKSPVARPLFWPLAALAAGAAPATPILGPHAQACEGAGPALLVRVEGLKARSGLVRVQSYGGDPARWFAKGAFLERVEVRAPAAGPLEVCLPVPRPGAYAVSVRHDVDGDGKGGLRDGGGMSGNPEFSLMDVILKRRPPPAAVRVEVAGVTRVPVVLNYVRGTHVGPIAELAR